jgi:hypothetical protein
MARRRLSVTPRPIDLARIPDALGEGAVLLTGLMNNERLPELAQRLQIRRQGGYAAIDVVVVLILFFTADLAGGLARFWQDTLRPVHTAIAALAGRRSLPSASAISRALGNVQTELIRPHIGWMLHELPGIAELLVHPAVCHADTNGANWHVFDDDPTITTLHHRPLPRGADLPEPTRLAQRIATPGYTGRKRGDLRFIRRTISHPGAGVFIHAHLAATTKDPHDGIAAGLDSIVQTCDAIDHPLAFALVRADGEFGHVPYFHACRQRKLPFLTRLNRNHLLHTDVLRRKLSRATWTAVPDSGAGPQRFATELGVFTVLAGKTTRQPDGSPYPPIQIRVIASRFRKQRDAKRGEKLGKWQVELFAVDLPADAWPAAEAMGLYFGRSGAENLYGQEDRELGLDRILSYHLPGQELAVAVGLMVWNLRVMAGVRQEGLPPIPPPPSPREEQPSQPSDPDWPRDKRLLTLLGGADWSALLAKRPGWSMDSSSGELVCADGRRLSLTTVRSREAGPGRTGVIFRRPKGGCLDCPHRPGCLRSERVETGKHVEVGLPTEVATAIRERLAQSRSGEESIGIEDIEASPGPWAVQASRFLPASARQVWREALSGLQLRIEITLPPPPPPRPRLLARDDADRQRRRLTWTQHRQRYALPDDTDIHIEVAGTASIINIFKSAQGQENTVKRTA